MRNLAQTEQSTRTGRVYFVSAAVCTGGGRECGHSRGVGPPKSRKRGGKIANGDFENLYKLQIRNPWRVPWGKCAVSSARGWMPTSVQILLTLAKSVPQRGEDLRFQISQRSGPVWHVQCIIQTSEFSALRECHISESTNQVSHTKKYR